MKKLFTLLCICLCSIAIHAEVETGTCGDNLTWSYDSETKALTITGSGAMTDYSAYDAPWYNVRKNILSISLPEGLTSIGDEAFSGCSGLTSVTIPDGVTSIGGGAFGYCSSLTSITIPDGVTSIGSFAFRYCDGLTSIIIPESVTRIGSYTFSYCSGLTSITIPESVTWIGVYAFEGCSGLTSVTWNAKNYSGITSGSSAPFYSIYSQITSFTFGDDVEHIPAYLCDGMSKLASITIPENVTSLGEYAFRGCSSLTSITIPESVTSIGTWLLLNCSSLAYIISLRETPIPLKGHTMINDKTKAPKDILLIVPENSVALYQAAPYWKEFDVHSQGFARTIAPTKTTAFVKAQYVSVAGDNILHGRLGYVFNNDTIWNNDANDSISFTLTGLIPSTTYSFGLLTDSIPTATIYSFTTLPADMTVTSGNVTQTTARVTLDIDCGDISKINCCGFTYYQSNQSDVVDTIFFESTEPITTLDTLLIGLLPDTYYYVTPFVDIDGVCYYGNTANFTTQSISASLTLGTKTHSTVPVKLTYNYGDADELNSGLNGIEYCEGASFESATKINTIRINSELSTLTLDTIIRGLKYGTTYCFRPYVVTTSDERIYGTVRNTTTSSISWDMNVLNATQTTASLHLTHDFGDAAIDYLSCKAIGYTDTLSFNLHFQEPQGEIDTVLTHLQPNTSYKVLVYTMKGSAVVGSPISTTFTTLPVFVGTPSVVEYGQTYAVVNSSYDYGDATLVRNVLEFKLSAEDDAEISTTANITGTQTKVTNLLPDTTYYFRHVLEIEERLGVLYDFENAEDNTHWHFINDTQTNQWVIGTSAGSSGAGSSALYISSNGSNYSYATKTSTVWVYCDEVLSGAVTISFEWQGTGESSYDYMYAYLVPVSAGQPAAGSTTAPTGAIQIGSRFNAQSSWTTFADAERILTEPYHLYFMWCNNATYSSRPIAIDNVNINVHSEISEGGVLTTDWQEFSTKAISLTTQTADGISNTSALLHGTIDCDQESYTEIGFEWKRSDAPPTYQPQRLLVTDRVDENLLFRLEGLSSDKWYDFRTFCSYLGETYYGEWQSFVTTDKEVLVAPTVQTVGAEITEQGVEMEGFVVAGTEPMLQQGFEVWVKGTTNVLTTVAEGTIMHAYIPEVRSYTAYQYRAYAKTAAGTTYGATLEIETGYIKQNVQDVTVTPSATEATITWTVVEDAAYYLLTLFADEAQTDTVGVYEVGTDGVITRRNKPGAVQSLVNCLVEELEPDTEYFFSVVAYNAADQKVAEETGWFATELPTSLVFTTDEENSASAPHVRKILYKGQVLILRDGKTYNLFGQEVR